MAGLLGGDLGINVPFASNHRTFIPFSSGQFRRLPGVNIMIILGYMAEIPARAA
ncbi:hypothetical protein GDI0360 [Gluconacetobacter diazotrophicus PA1 5]|uniref:Uncharacterized protein n=1 Tax=Gluconacetobacter diazotrophicus (strain ATCC 49037 / DSM 5601 / CCUG 37298 / CIP 103539 / LMG 7603 / PAl5) TaxID=272568 RepID=A9H596_GLUDA|nr:hypothetical protein GDI0360 [Gluconacetobacter diazotrophicus PA1 5]